MRAKLRINFATKPAQTFACLMKSCILQQALKLGRDAESKPEAGKISQHESGAAEKMWGNLLIKTCATKGAGSGGAGWQIGSAEGRVPEHLSWKASSSAIRIFILPFTCLAGPCSDEDGAKSICCPLPLRVPGTPQQGPCRPSIRTIPVLPTHPYLWPVSIPDLGVYWYGSRGIKTKFPKRLRYYCSNLGKLNEEEGEILIFRMDSCKKAEWQMWN